MLPLIRVIDLETCGLEPADGVCEIAAVDIWAGRVCDALTTFVDPGRDIPPEVSAIHHITDKDVVGAPMFRSAWQSFPVMDRVEVFAAHNAQFERSFISTEMTKGQPWICTFKCAMRLWPDAPSFSNQGLRYWLKLRLQASYANNSHRAGPDAYVTAHILIRMLKEMKWERLVEWTGQPAQYPKCPIGKHRGDAWSTIPYGYLKWMTTAGDMDDDLKMIAAAEMERRP